MNIGKHLITLAIPPEAAIAGLVVEIKAKEPEKAHIRELQLRDPNFYPVWKRYLKAKVLVSSISIGGELQLIGDFSPIIYKIVHVRPITG